MRRLGAPRLWLILLGLLALWLSVLPMGDRLEAELYHGLLRALPVVEAPGEVRVLAIDTASLQAYGPWPWPAERQAELQRALTAAGARVVGLALPVATRRQATALAGAEATVLAWPAALDAPRRGLQSLPARAAVDALPAAGQPWYAPLLRPPRHPVQPAALPLDGLDPARVGLLPLPAEGRPVWAEPLMLVVNGVYRPTFAFDLLARVRGVAPTESLIFPGPLRRTGVQLGEHFIASDAALRVYPRPRVTPRVFSAAELLRGELPPAALRGRPVLVGLTAASSSYGLRAPGGARPAPVLWQASLLNALLDGQLLRVPGWAYAVQRGGLLMVLIYLLLLPARLRGRGGLWLAAGLALLAINGALLGLLLEGLWLPLALPVALLLVGQGVLSWAERGRRRLAELATARDDARLTLAASLRGAGRLDEAWEQLRDLPPTVAAEALYDLGLAAERRRQFGLALQAYDRIAEAWPDYRDIAERRRHQRAVAPAPPVAGTAGMAGTLVVDDPRVERPVLGRYEVERELGRGAMGVVYLGRDPRIGRTVAIKTLSLAEAGDATERDALRERFLREAETAGRLSHPDIVTVYDAGEEHDLAWLAMDYVAGESLESFIHGDELLPMGEVFALGVRLAEALDYAHAQQVVHRDIKPANILYDRASGQLKITDFGIARLTDHSRTRTGTVLGSPFYMSPEQLAGQAVDGRADLFSLGVTLYQLFCGQLPFQGENLNTLLYRIANERPRPIRKQRAELPPCLTRVINRALDKAADKRYPSGQALADALRACGERAGVLKH